MPHISLINPLDQPTGSRRLLEELRKSLSDNRFSVFRLAVAFAKSGPLLRLESELKAWKENGGTTKAIIGVDLGGTSKQALALALDLFDRVYITTLYNTKDRNITFHPKLYLFSGNTAARCYVGSNNLTVGGTETNFEMAVHVDVDLPSEKDIVRPFTDAWLSLLPKVCPATRRLDDALLAQLTADGVLGDEQSKSSYSHSAGAQKSGGGGLPRSGLTIKPPSALPKSVLQDQKTAEAAKLAPKGTTAKGLAHIIASSVPAHGFAIQIKPHHNGEIFLSVTAALQNPAFFKWPFTGKTTPKKASNPSYPQMSPDPVVNISVYGASQTPILTQSAYELNTVYYQTKSEIRITASPLVGTVPDYSVMLMEKSEEVGIDYEIMIHRPDSPEYSKWVAACNQTMPGGGQTPRKFGWF